MMKRSQHIELIDLKSGGYPTVAKVVVPKTYFHAMGHHNTK